MTEGEKSGDFIFSVGRRFFATNRGKDDNLFHADRVCSDSPAALPPALFCARLGMFA
jgi:hypothetical protein